MGWLVSCGVLVCVFISEFECQLIVSEVIIGVDCGGDLGGFGQFSICCFCFFCLFVVLVDVVDVLCCDVYCDCDQFVEFEGDFVFFCCEYGFIEGVECCQDVGCVFLIVSGVFVVFGVVEVVGGCGVVVYGIDDNGFVLMGVWLQFVCWLSFSV